MQGFLKFLRIFGIVVLCLLILLSVCVLPSYIDFPTEGGTESPEESQTAPPESTPIEAPTETEPPETELPREYITVDGEALGIVDASKVKYGYSEMVDDLQKLAAKYENKMSYESIGTSLDGRNIYAVTLGNPNAEKQILITAGIHGREYLTPLLVMKQIEFYLYNYDTAEYGGVPLSKIFEEFQFCILPMCNPDGITLAMFGIGAIKNAELKETITEIYRSDKSRGYVDDDSMTEYLTYWKSNARGVDLNRNFDTADWESVSYVSQPSFRNYKGETPLSEPESRAMADYTESLSNPVLSIAVHSQGEVIYFDCGQKNIHPSLNLAKKVSELTGYDIIYDTKHDAAFDDWCIINKNIPSVTVETGEYSVDEPISISEFESIWNSCRDMWVHVAVEYMD